MERREKNCIRMWKKGKHWVFGVTTIGLLFLGTTTVSGKVLADETAQAIVTTEISDTDSNLVELETSSGTEEQDVTTTLNDNFTQEETVPKESDIAIVNDESVSDVVEDTMLEQVTDEQEEDDIVTTGSLESKAELAQTVTLLDTEKTTTSSNRFLSLDQIKASDTDVSSSVIINAYIISGEAASSFHIPDSLGWQDIQISRAILKLDESGYYVMGYNGVTGKAVILEYDQEGGFIGYHEVTEAEGWVTTEITNLPDVTQHQSSMSDQAWETHFSLTRDPLTEMLIFSAQNLALTSTATSYGMGPTISLVVRESLSEGTVRVTVDVLDSFENVIKTIELGYITKTNYADLTNAANAIRAEYLEAHPEYHLVTNYITTNDGVIVLTPEGYYNPGTYLQGNDTQYTIQFIKGTYQGETIYSGVKKLFLGNDLLLDDLIVLRDGTQVSYSELLAMINSESGLYSAQVDSYMVTDTDGDGDIDLDDYGRVGWTLQKSAYVDYEGNKVYGLDYWYLCPPSGHLDGDFTNEHEDMALTISADFSYYGYMTLYTWNKTDSYWTIYGRLYGVPKGYAAGNHVHFTVAPAGAAVVPDSPTKPQVTEKTQSINDSVLLPVNQEVQRQSILPITGDSQSSSMTIIGIASLLIAGSFSLWKKGRKNKLSD